MDKAIEAIKKEFSTWEGCELHAIKYTSDDCNSKENIKYVNELDEEKDFTQAIIFVSDFHSPKEAIGAWEEDKKYEDWNWILARTDGGEWQLLTWGY